MAAQNSTVRGFKHKRAFSTHTGPSHLVEGVLSRFSSPHSEMLPLSVGVPSYFKRGEC